LLCERKGFAGAHNTQLLAIDANQADFVDTDFTVDAVFFFGCDVKDSWKLIKRGYQA
jgi:hypothetical protein